MKAVIFSLSLGSALAIKCTHQTPSFGSGIKIGDNSVIGFSWGGISKNREIECGYPDNTENYACSHSYTSGSYKVSGVNWGFKTDNKRCLRKEVCDQLAGGTDMCQIAKYEIEDWTPTSCDSNNDYGAIVTVKTAEQALSCCDTADHCNEQDENWDTCTVKDKFSNYLQGLQTCWNEAKRGFMTDLFCADGGASNFFTIHDSCYEADGSWKSSKKDVAACLYKTTCSAKMRKELLDFGTCACTAAKTNGYSGSYIGTAMEAGWQKFCPNIDIACSDKGQVEVLYKFWKVKYNFKVALAKAGITDEMIEEWKKKFGEKLKVHPTTIDITITVNTDSNNARRLMAGDYSDVNVVFRAEDENAAGYANGVDLLDTVKTATGDDTATQTGGTETVESDEKSTGTYEGSSGAAMVSVQMVSLVAMFVVIATFML